MDMFVERTVRVLKDYGVEGYIDIKDALGDLLFRYDEGISDIIMMLSDEFEVCIGKHFDEEDTLEDVINYISLLKG